MLAEMTVVDNLQYIIYGIGINVNINQCDFPQEIQQTATSLSEVSGTKIDQEQLLIHVIQCLDQQYHKVLDNQSINIKKEYEEKCITLNQEIKVHTPNESYVAVARDIAEDGALIINREGEIQLVYAGDVSVRGIDGYI